MTSTLIARLFALQGRLLNGSRNSKVHRVQGSAGKSTTRSLLNDKCLAGGG